MTSHPSITDDNKRWWVLATMTGALSMLMLDQTVVSVALHTIGRDLDISGTGVQWIVNAYLLALGALVAVGGRIGDLIGPERTFRIGAGIFILASAACGLAPTDWALIAARAVQGAGAALMAPATGAIMVATFSPKERGKAMGIYSGVSMIFLALGPLVGGLLTDSLSWRAVFYVNLPIGLAMLLVSRVSLPAPPRPERTHGLDWIGAGLLVAGLAGLVLALMQGTAWGWGSPAIIVLLATAAVLLPAFVIWERRQSDPIVDLRVLKLGNVTPDSAVLAATQFALAGVTVFGALWVQGVLGYGPVEAGVSLLPLTLALLVTAPNGGRLYDRIGPRVLLIAGPLCVAAGLGVMAAVVGQESYAPIVPGYVLMGVGLGLTISPATTDSLSAAGPAQRGQVSGLTQMMRQIGGTIGVAVLGAIVVHVQKADTVAGVSPTKIASDAVSSAYWAGAGVVAGSALVAAVAIKRRATAPVAVAPAA